jgi:hypothetical protein
MCQAGGRGLGTFGGVREKGKKGREGGRKGERKEGI